LLTDALARRLPDPDRARSLATLVIASIEGAVVVARAVRSTEPVEDVGGELERLLTAALAGDQSP
jgi:TetR/AcrR family transcriptional regulator, lmrAB and yxaGH operons repressor